MSVSQVKIVVMLVPVMILAVVMGIYCRPMPGETLTIRDVQIPDGIDVLDTTVAGAGCKDELPIEEFLARYPSPTIMVDQHRQGPIQLIYLQNNSAGGCVEARNVLLNDPGFGRVVSGFKIDENTKEATITLESNYEEGSSGVHMIPGPSFLHVGTFLVCLFWMWGVERTTKRLIK